MTDDTVRAISIDLKRNRLTLHLQNASDVHPSGHTSAPVIATLDMGTGGRLLGVDLDGRYLTVSEPGPADIALTRSVEAPVTAYADDHGAVTAVDIPRRGSGFEITYPSGNR